MIRLENYSELGSSFLHTMAAHKHMHLAGPDAMVPEAERPQTPVM